MKKFIYAILVAATVSLTISSCTDEQIKPRADAAAAGLADSPVHK